MRQLAIAAFVTGIAFTATAGLAQAGILNVYAVQVDNSGGGAALDGFITTDIFIDFEGQYNGSQMLLQLGGDQIYQDAVGSDFPPSPVFIGVFPSLEFDTFLTLGTAVDESPTNPNPAIFSGAVDLGGAPSAIINNSILNAAWGAPGGVAISDQVGFLVARLTLAETVNGILSFLSSAGGDISPVFEVCIANGIMPLTCIPEPSGDFDEDSDVDGADFLYWQLNDGSESNLDLWQTTFGDLSSPITAASTTVPEPAAGIMLILGIASLLFLRHLEA
jgi:hypothetical protein